MTSREKNDDAVSPVVGVMLMLVVTIIIAAIVSGFAGGLASGTSKPVQATIKADYSQNNGMTITHTGGDTINTLQTKIIVAPTADFGGYEHLRWEVSTANVNVAKDGGGRPWFDPKKSSGELARTFQPGEMAVVRDLAQVQPAMSGEPGETDVNNVDYGFQNKNARGQRFILSIVDDTGRTIAQTEVLIRP
ncbi:hypothetical protein L21_0126 [Methanoculleus chikugoensis]|uniref:Archaeal Type IV pilin N-terminal domain-containing protein n=1 Tax=Methanoculleus chikugoensis TaxID=118126 RepID=A0A1M4MHD1_9EURY|nr:type IV pilin N-terminal domain-containing protein [Methanoculleus chikugoensis]SCL74258.1 hypothetical protein L21_0126 [Methanoculleus chikugoensis]